ncbi:MAG: hypothetical protein GY906_15530 [bacterium]|nr:hypothetical protein [bacterium]
MAALDISQTLECLLKTLGIADRGLGEAEVDKAVGEHWKVFKEAETGEAKGLASALVVAGGVEGFAFGEEAFVERIG